MILALLYMAGALTLVGIIGALVFLLVAGALIGYQYLKEIKEDLVG